MRWLRRFRERALWEKRLESELQFHLEQQKEAYVAAGLSEAEARRRAAIDFGGLELTKEECREARGMNVLEIIVQDLRFGLRMLRKNPGFAAVAVVALALGIGFTTIIFSVFYNGFLYPFPYRDAQRLSVIGIVDTGHNSERFREVYRLDEVVAFRTQNKTLEDVVAYTGWDAVYLHQGISEPLHGCVLTPNAMGFWGVPPLLGRGLDERDAEAGASPVVLISYAFWRSAFNEDKGVLGTKMILNKQAYTVVGVMPRRFGLFGADFYAPVSWSHPEPASFSVDEPWTYFFATALIRPNVSLQTASADLQVIAQRLQSGHRKDYPEHFQMTARPLNEVIVDDFKQTLLLLIAAVVLLLLISSSNVASLLLTHHSARAREIALRAALGAGRTRLIRQLLVESLLLAMAGCMLGCLLAYLGLQVIRLVPGVGVPGEADMSLNLPVLFFAVLLSLLTTLFFGLSPALLAVKKDLRTHLQTIGGGADASRSGVRIRAGLVVGQVALSMLLLVFAGLMIRSFFAVTKFDPGMSTQGLLRAVVQFPAHQYESIEKRRAFSEQVESRISTLPGVTHMAVAFGFPPLGGPRTEDITIPGKPHDKHWDTGFDLVNEGYFPTVGLRLLRGRLLSPDDVAGARRVAVVSARLVKNYLDDEDPLGRQIKFNVFDEEPSLPHDAYFQIVGVVNDLKRFDPKEPELLPQAYVPYTVFGGRDYSILVRSVANPSLLTNPLRQIVADLDPNVVVGKPSTLEDELQLHVFLKPKFRLISFGACAGIGLGLALIGLFGVMAYSVTLQTHELGVRMALGAHPSNILTFVLRKALLLIGSGILLGLLTSFFTVRILQSQLWGVSPFDPWTLILAPAALLLVGLLACYLPARRATRVDPMAALRYE